MPCHALVQRGGYRLSRVLLWRFHASARGPRLRSTAAVGGNLAGSQVDPRSLANRVAARPHQAIAGRDSVRRLEVVRGAREAERSGIDWLAGILCLASGACKLREPRREPSIVGSCVLRLSEQLQLPGLSSPQVPCAFSPAAACRVKDTSFVFLTSWNH